MSQLTVFLARLLGLFTILVVAALLLRGNVPVEAAVANQPVMLVYGFISLGLGFAMVLGHNVWSGGVLPVVITLVGWLILFKGLLLLVLTPETLMQFYGQLHYGRAL
jgi:hypothetical protein